ARDGGPPRPGVRVRHGRPGCAHRRPPVPRRAPPRRDHRARRPDRALRPVQDGVRGQEVPCHGARGPSGRGDDRGVRDVRRPPRGARILGQVTLVQIPWLPVMMKKRSGFSEEEDLF
ncbi:hypothetical protein THAOC_25870, partial [Thalassiosira oceanica]